MAQNSVHKYYSGIIVHILMVTINKLYCIYFYALSVMNIYASDTLHRISWNTIHYIA